MSENNQELSTLQTELTIARQEKEIMELKFELQKTQAEKASRLEDSLFAPALFDHYQKVAQVFSTSGVVPKAYIGKPNDIFIAMGMGYQLGFPIEQSLQDIAVINGRPCLWGDGLLSLCLNHPACEGIDEEPIYKDDKFYGYSCTVRRKGHKPHTQTFTLDDAVQAKLISKPGAWEGYPKRMVQLRARGFAVRDKFADALRGLRIAEIEKEDGRVIDGEVVEERKQERVEELKKKANNVNKNDSTGKENDQPIGDDDPIHPELLTYVNNLIKEKNLTEKRMTDALNYFKVDSIESMTNKQANDFINMLKRVK
jgi:hypothetical protein